MTDSKHPSKTNQARFRLLILRSLIMIFFILIFSQLFYVQIIQHKVYAALADGQQQVIEQLFPQRGRIFSREDDGQLYPLADNHNEDLLAAEPWRLTNVPEVVDKLKNILALTDTEAQLLSDKLNDKEKRYYPIKHRLTVAQSEAVKNLDIVGLQLIPEPWRIYSEGEITSNLLGFVGFNDDKKIGRYGLEQYWEKQLAGQMGYLSGFKSGGGSLIAAATKVFEPAANGDDLVLTINRSLQFIACKGLIETVKKWEAAGGAVVVMEPQSGAILAMCSAPTFDANNYQQVEDIAAYENHSLIPYEPGSVFKPIAMAVALEVGAVTPQTTFEDPGQISIGGFSIKNAKDKNWGKQTMVGVLEHSINTGMVFVMRKTTPAVLAKYVPLFGFGSPSGVELIRDNPGNISSLKKGGEIYAATASFGQGITVTPIQLAAAYSALVNGGRLMKPYVVSELIKSDGTKQVTQPQVVRQVISPAIASTIKAMLVSVVKNGPILNAQIPNFWVGGKTGTAQIADQRGQYYEDRANHTFAGFAPGSNPAVVVIVKLETPKVAWAEGSAAPLFKEITMAALRLLRISPDNL